MWISFWLIARQGLGIHFAIGYICQKRYYEHRKRL